MKTKTTMRERIPERSDDAPAPRAFTLLDAMILIAAAAVGMAWYRSVPPTYGRAIAPLVSGRTFAARLGGFSALVEASLPLLAALTFAVVVLRFRPPRPRFRHLARQPGLVACGLATLLILGASVGALAIGLAHLKGPLALRPGISPIAGLLFQTLADWSYLIGVAVVVAWFVLGVGRRGRAEPGWVDRLGRAAGIAWIVLAPVLIGLKVMILVGALL